MRPLLLVAGGGMAREIADLVVAAGSHHVVGVLDDDTSSRGRLLAGAPVIGGLDSVLGRPDADVVLCAGSGHVRARMRERLDALGVAAERFPALVAPTIRVPDGCTIAQGAVLMTGVVLTADVAVGRHVVCMPGAVLTHDVRLDDFATLASGVLLGGGVAVGARAYLGMGCAVRQHLRVGAGATVGMGAVVVRDVDDGTTVVGVPARQLEVGAA